MPNSADHDYKAIFAHPDMVRDVITGFVPGPWLSEIDFATLSPYKSSFVSDGEDAKGRDSDAVWRVRYGEEWIYIYLMFEFQSTINPHMSIRMMVYLGLLYQDLIVDGTLKAP